MLHLIYCIVFNTFYLLYYNHFIHYVALFTLIKLHLSHYIGYTALQLLHCIWCIALLLSLFKLHSSHCVACGAFITCLYQSCIYQIFRPGKRVRGVYNLTGNCLFVHFLLKCKKLGPLQNILLDYNYSFGTWFPGSLSLSHPGLLHWTLKLGDFWLTERHKDIVRRESIFII